MPAIVLKPHDFNSTKRKLICASVVYCCTVLVQLLIYSGASTVWYLVRAGMFSHLKQALVKLAWDLK